MADISQQVSEAIQATRADLEALIAIASVSSQSEHDKDVWRAAQFVAEQARSFGCDEVEVVAEGGAPAVIARIAAPEGKPTLCLYAHYDVQPAGDLASWTSQPFVACERDARLYGRGSADDKGGVGVHLAVLKAFEGRPPVGVTLFIEGEEEVGSPSMGAILERHHDELKADVFIIADSVNWAVGAPSLTNTLRGVADCVVEVSTLKSGVHSGEYGGVVPDALTALCRLLATLHDDEGNVAVAGLKSYALANLEYSPDQLRDETGVLEGVQFIGSGSLVDRMWGKPAISVLALDTTQISDASNTLIPSARAKVSLRVAPGDDADRALGALRRHLETNAPWGAHVKVTLGQVGQPSVIAADEKVVALASEAMSEAWGRPPVFMGMGGSIPMINDFQMAFPDATVLVSAVTDPSSRMHGIDESLDLGDWGKAVLAEALLVQKLAES